MGGAIAVHAASSNLIPSLVGLIVIDVVEGTHSCNLFPCVYVPPVLCINCSSVFIVQLLRVTHVVTISYVCKRSDCSILTDLIVEEILNKKVLLRERKRHTARHVASARYAALPSVCVWGGGVPQPGLDGGGVPHQRGGTPCQGSTPARSG